MTVNSEMFSQALPAPPLKARGETSAPARGGTSSKPQSDMHALPGADDIDWVGLGKVLREARESCHGSHEGAADKLCLSGKQIRALECGSVAPFPGATVRSWCARRYATLLGLDWDQLAQSLRSEEPDAAIGTTSPPTSSPVEPVSGAASAQFRFGLLLGAAVLTFITVIAISGNG